ncbi:MAG TPA: hypothetical protein VKV69_10865 [Actinomycetota bacterium]|nr:hypothetical protein [Actinomycetota bacterium]
MPRRSFVSALFMATLCFSALAQGSAFASPRVSGPTLSISSGAATVNNGTMSVPVGSAIHIASTNLDPTKQAVLYKGEWQPTSQFVGWAYVYYAGYTPSSSGTLGLDEAQNQTGTFRYQVCQSSTSKGKTTSVCSPFVELTVS